VSEKTILLPPSPNGHDAAYRLTVMVPKRRYVSYLRERWWVVVLCLALSVSAVIIFETVHTETFNSYAQLYITTGAQVGVTLFAEPKDDFATQIELLKGSRLRGAALEDLGAKADKLKAPIDIEVVRPMNTAILQLRATSPDPVLTQVFLQSLITRYLAFNRDTRVSTAENLVTSLNEQLTKLEEALKTEQEKWVEFQKSNTLPVLEEQAKGAGLYLADLNLQVAKLKLEEQLLQNGVSPSSTPASSATNAATPASTNSTMTLAASLPGSSSDTPTTASDAPLKSARLELAVARAEKAKLLSQFAEGHPALREINSTIERLTNTVAILEQQDVQQRQSQLADVQKRIAAMTAAIPNVEKQVLEANERLSESKRYQNGVQRQQGHYDSLLAMLQYVDLGKNMGQERITVLDPPSPARPAERNLPLRIFLAVVGGLAVGLGIVFVWHLLDDRFVSILDVKDNFGEPVLGLVPQIKVGRNKPHDALLKENDSRSAYAESYRHLRSALLLSTLGGSRPHTLLFTGAAPLEGKSTIAANVAKVLARSGLRVVLIDADTHAGSLGHLLGVEGKPGVLDYLRREAATDVITHPTDVPGLELVPAGTHLEHAEGLFLRPELGALMNDLKTGRDFVIIDGAPILGADDAALLVPHADTVVLVLRPFFSRSRHVRQALEMLYQRQAKQVAMILNRARKDDLAGHYARNGQSQAKNGARNQGAPAERGREG
jgi:Mrp family chromosome partitioning ATPase/uncharacterized protein involved in exopolysaccharide biosynthesis